ncbi:MAG: hypothetical protein VKP72_00965 [bacterium]|nr:hypothetical protein [bacterium]
MARSPDPPGDFLQVVGATPARTLAVTFRVVAPWVTMLWIGLGRILDLPPGTISRALTAEAAGFLVTWALGSRRSFSWIQALSIVCSVGLAGTVLALTGARTSTTDLLLVLAAALQTGLTGLVRAHLILGKPLPVSQLVSLIMWHGSIPRPLDWQPRRLPPRLRRLLLDRFPPPARTPSRPDPADLVALDVSWPCTRADLDRALARAREHVATVPAARKREALRAIQRAGQAVQRLENLLAEELAAADNPATESAGTGWLNLESLWDQAVTEDDRRLVVGCLRYLDPVRSARLSGVLTSAALVEGMHPGDRGDPHAHHAFSIVIQGALCTFVWVPVFEAYQIIRPAHCGRALARRPRGAWVARRPPAGLEDVDWAHEVFGGFYVARTLASRQPSSLAVSHAPGPQAYGLLQVVPGGLPWVEVTWEEAVEICHHADPACHLLKDDEYTALAVWAMMHGHMDPLFRLGPASHTGNASGVLLPPPGMAEWTASLVGDRRQWGGVPAGLDADGSGPRAGFIAALSTDPARRRYGIPDATQETRGGFGSGRLEPPGRDPVAGVRGGSGLWGLSLTHHREGRHAGVGFRPVLQYGLAPVEFPGDSLSEPAAGTVNR